MRRIAVALTLLILSLSPAMARDRAAPGQFDYYILSLSWSPTWCGGKAGRTDGEQCGGARHYGFVVHGLWPQYAKGGFPAQCAAPQPVPAQVVDDMLPLMPSRKLIQHEWARHGTCDGSAPADYFARTRLAYESVRIPTLFQSPEAPQALSVEQVEKLFIDANPGLDRKGLAVVCRGHQASEVRVCLDRDLKFRACARDVRPRCKGAAQFPVAR
ncbi:MAG TPA: ribonuclease T2 [Magnetospirillum sp.]|nr:ribonuclease T2 [Magnetospirillum sp.]